eukprot:209548-Rhodomonas_salina.1
MPQTRAQLRSARACGGWERSRHVHVGTRLGVTFGEGCLRACEASQKQRAAREDQGVCVKARAALLHTINDPDVAA